MWLTVIDAPNGSRELAATGCPSNGKPGDGERSASALLREFPSQAHSVLDEFSRVPFSAESPPGQSLGQFQDLLHATRILWINMRKLVCWLRRCQLLGGHKAAESAADSKLRQLLDSVFSVHFQPGIRRNVPAAAGIGREWPEDLRILQCKDKPPIRRIVPRTASRRVTVVRLLLQ